jgi:hypothetical protein
MTTLDTEGSVPAVLQFQADGLSFMTGDTMIVQNSVMVEQTPYLNSVIGVKLSGSISLSYTLAMSPEVPEGAIGGETIPLKIGVMSGGLIPGGTVPAGTTVPVSWSYEITLKDGTSVNNESVVFAASLPPSGGGTVSALYSGDPLGDNRMGGGTLEFQNEVISPMNGLYDMFLMLDWTTGGFGEADLITIDFGTSSLDVNKIPEPASAMLVAFAVLLGVVARRKR